MQLPLQGGSTPKVSFSSCKNCANCLGPKDPKASHELLDVLCSYPSIQPAVNTMSLRHTSEHLAGAMGVASSCAETSSVAVRFCSVIILSSN